MQETAGRIENGLVGKALKLMSAGKHPVGSVSDLVGLQYTLLEALLKLNI